MFWCTQMPECFFAIFILVNHYIIAPTFFIRTLLSHGMSWVHLSKKPFLSCKNFWDLTPIVAVFLRGSLLPLVNIVAMEGSVSESFKVYYFDKEESESPKNLDNTQKKQAHHDKSLWMLTFCESHFYHYTDCLEYYFLFMEAIQASDIV